MINENEKLDQLFEKFNNQWDSQELEQLHEDRFLEKLNKKKTKKNYLVSIAIAASIVVMIGLSMFNNTRIQSTDLEFASKETRQTDSIFSVIIDNQLEKIKEKESPMNQKIIDDALVQMKTLDSDYEKIKQELEKNGESKQIIYAMISNLQTRITFLQNILQHIENNEKLNKLSHEKTT